jgi:NhaP-type Na+/H+ or K+/H+ antiporter
MTEFVLLFILAFAAIVLLYSLISRRLEGTVITAQIVFVAAGLLLGPAAFGLIDAGEGTEAILIIAEIALVLTLFSDAARIDFGALRQGRMLPIRLLVVGLPLTILLGGLVAAGMLPGITIAEAALIGAVLAPTDAALGKAIVTNPRIPVKIRQALNVESGLNDGGAIPFFYFFLALAVAEAEHVPEQSLAVSALVLIGIGIVVGLVVGFLGAGLVDAAEKRGWMTGAFRWIAFLALALIAWVAAETLGGSGFIAAFVGGLAVAASGRDIGKAALEFAEVEGEVLNLAVFFILGLFAATMLARFTGTVLLYAVLSLTVIRMLPVAISLIGTRLSRTTVLVMGWFGPRGLASIVLLLIIFVDAAALPGMATVQAVIVTTVLLSVFAHGISAAPIIDRYAAIVESLPADAQEKADVTIEPGQRPGP